MSPSAVMLLASHDSPRKQDDAFFNRGTIFSVLIKGEEFVPTTVAPETVKFVECFPNNGLDYTGNLDVTMAGHVCLPWSAPEVQTLSKDKEFIPEVTLTANKCRNPDNDMEGPWCYVRVAGNVTIDYCDLEICGK